MRTRTVMTVLALTAAMARPPTVQACTAGSACETPSAAATPATIGEAPAMPDRSPPRPPRPQATTPGMARAAGPQAVWDGIAGSTGAPTAAPTDQADDASADPTAHGGAAAGSAPMTDSDHADRMDEAGGTPGGPAPDPAADLPVLHVTGIEVLRTAGEPHVAIIRATGLASSAGWQAPILVPTSTDRPADGILDLELIAAPPGQAMPATGLVPMDAILVLEPGDPYKGFRVHGAVDAVELDKTAGLATAQTHDDGCGRCVGQAYGGDDGADTPPSPGQPANAIGTAHADLPRNTRVVTAQGGAGGSPADPNRLTVVLGADGRIVDAFWE